MKVLLPHLAADDGLARKFLKEARIAAQFHHPNIAMVFEAGEIPASEFSRALAFPLDILKSFGKNFVYFTMQFIEGQTLASLIKKEKTLSPFKALFIGKEVCKALHYAHLKGIVHRDIKPENIMLTHDDLVLVTDFGIARAVSARGSEETAPLGDHQEVEKTKGFMGTPLYVSPEQITDGEVDGRSDLYSLGCSLYELLTGQPPFRGKTWMEVLAKQINDAPPPPQELRPDLPVNFSELILQLLAKKKEDRLRDAQELLERLSELDEFLRTDRLEIQKLQTVTAETYDQVKKLFFQFSKALKTIASYPETHSLVDTAVERLHEIMSHYFQQYSSLDFEIFSMEIFFQGEAVYNEDQKENAFCFNMFRDGVRHLTFYRGIPQTELRTFLLSVHRYLNQKKNYEMDLVTLLFQLELKYLDFEYVDSFYEDPQTQSKITQLIAAHSKKESWTLPAALEHGFEGQQLLSYRRNVDQALSQRNEDQIRDRLIHPDLSRIRLEAIQLCLKLMVEEIQDQSFDHHYELMEEVIYNCIAEDDFGSAVYVLHSLQQWAVESGQNDPRAYAAKFLALQERLSDQEFLERLLQKLLRQNRALSDQVKSLLGFLLPNQVIPLLFDQFSKEEEISDKRLMAELCVVVAGPNIDVLTQSALSLEDDDAALFLRGYSFLHSSAPSNTFLRWLQHPGPQTRRSLVSVLDHCDRPETTTVLKKIAGDGNIRYQEARKRAWMALERRAPKAFEELLADQLHPQRFFELSPYERRMVVDASIGTFFSRGGETLMLDILMQSGGLSGSRLDLEEREYIVKKMIRKKSTVIVPFLEKSSKRLFGDRDFVQFCKRILETLDE
jgi:serine/threonine protein kinase